MADKLVLAVSEKPSLLPSWPSPQSSYNMTTDFSQNEQSKDRETQEKATLFDLFLEIIEHQFHHILSTGIHKEFGYFLKLPKLQQIHCSLYIFKYVFFSFYCINTMIYNDSFSNVNACLHSGTNPT